MGVPAGVVAKRVSNNRHGVIGLKTKSLAALPSCANVPEAMVSIMTIAKINFFTFDLKSIELNYDFTSTNNSQYAFSCI
jgi:hypothetical protein